MIEGYEFDLQPYCSGCIWFEPEATCATNSKDKPIWNIRCKHKGQCVRLVRHLNKKMEAQNEKKLED